MGIIKGIKLSSIEECLKEVTGMSFQIRLFQEEYEDVINQTKSNKKNLAQGSIPKDVYEKNLGILESEKKRLKGRINETIRRARSVNEKVRSLADSNRI